MDDISEIRKVIPVSRETVERLETFVALLRKWQHAENLVSSKTLDEVWRRHIADSAELVPLFPGDRRWLDIGTGAGFPGLVIAIVGGAEYEVDLIESNRRKCAFLREAIRQTGAVARVHEGRAEALLGAWSAPVDRIAARAVAPLAQLLEICEPLMTRGVPAAFHKGRGFEAEVAEASGHWTFDLVRHQSQSGEGGAILEIKALNRKPNQVR